MCEKCEQMWDGFAANILPKVNALTGPLLAGCIVLPPYPLLVACSCCKNETVFSLQMSEQVIRTLPTTHIRKPIVVICQRCAKELDKREIGIPTHHIDVNASKMNRSSTSTNSTN